MGVGLMLLSVFFYHIQKLEPGGCQIKTIVAVIK